MAKWYARREPDRRVLGFGMKRFKRRCRARARRGTECLASALANGRCRLHGGLSTGPKTLSGRRIALANLKQFRKSAANDNKEYG